MACNRLIGGTICIAFIAHTFLPVAVAMQVEPGANLAVQTPGAPPGAEYCVKDGVWTMCVPPVAMNVSNITTTADEEDDDEPDTTTTTAAPGTTTVAPVTVPPCDVTTKCCAKQNPSQIIKPTGGHKTTVIFTGGSFTKDMKGTNPCQNVYKPMLNALKAKSGIKVVTLNSPYKTWFGMDCLGIAGTLEKCWEPPNSSDHLKELDSSMQLITKAVQAELEYSKDVAAKDESVAPIKVMLVGHGQGCAINYYTLLNSGIVFEGVFDMICLGGWVPIKDVQKMAMTKTAMLRSLKKFITHFHSENDVVVPYKWAEMAKKQLEESNQPVDIVKLKNGHYGPLNDTKVFSQIVSKLTRG